MLRAIQTSNKKTPCFMHISQENIIYKQGTLHNRVPHPQSCTLNSCSRPIRSLCLYTNIILCTILFPTGPKSRSNKPLTAKQTVAAPPISSKYVHATYE